ncbi:substrate-binding domain-containing protein [Cohnella abietis]|uniref:LacI family transcriptional regulator n=1 Tax=Cohnella abietis TaxID=2507935 RepID=A0A3T1D0D1_9BACL|nr:substrate-binding domain-containing protein [Cohnella abietis]BBI31521.1 LacI family transcriptional regulator [Cohnella abietis]
MRWTFRRFIWILVAALMLVAIMSFWFTRNAKDDMIEIRVIIKSTDDSIEFWQVMKDGINIAAKEFGANVIVRGAKTESDIDEQIALVEEAIAEQPDAIILAANDYDRLVSVSEKVIKSGIKLFIVDSGIKADIAESTIATDNYKAGVKAGMEMRKQLGNRPAQVAIIKYVLASASVSDREDGVREVLGQDSNIEIFDTYYARGLEENAYEQMKLIMSEHPDVDGIICLNEMVSVGGGRAFRELNLKDKVVMIGFDSPIPVINLLEEDVIRATIVQKPFQMGYLSIKTAVDAIHGKKVPKTIDTGSVVITKQNMYEEKNQKLLFPFYGK